MSPSFGFACLRRSAIAPTAASATAATAIKTHAHAGRPPDPDELTGVAVTVPVVVLGGLVVVVLDDELLACDATAAPAATAAPGW